MKRKPRTAEALLLLCRTKGSSRNFQIGVECVDALERQDALMGGKLPAEKYPVTVRLQDGRLLDVTRADVEPAPRQAKQ